MIITPLASGSSGNCYRIECAGRTLLLECGLRYPEIQRGLDFQVSQLDGCLISHEHGDHSKAVKQMIRAGVDCYMSHGTRRELSLYGSEYDYRVRVVRAKDHIPIKSRPDLRSSEWQVLPFETQHDAAEPLGFIIARAGRKLLYATDTFYLKYRFEGLTHIMLEVNYADDLLAENVRSGEVCHSLKNRVRESHMSLATAKEMLAANDLSSVQEIWLLHLSDSNSGAERFKREIQEVTGKPVYVC